jgi:two-component system, sensor histidine kinase PdtaS
LQQLEQHVFSRVHTAPDEVYPEAWQLQAEAKAAGNWVMQSRAHYYLSSIWNWRNGLDSAHWHARKSLETALQSENASEISAGYNMMGNAWESLGQLDSAFNAFHGSYTWGEKAGDHKSIARALLNMGMIHRTRGEYLLALERLHEAKAACIEWNLPLYLPNLLRTIGEVYLHIGEYDLAWDNLHRALRIAQLNQRQRNIASTMLTLGDHALLIGDSTEAFCWYETSRSTAHDAQIPGMEAQANAKLVKIYLARRELPAALKAARNAVAQSQEDEDTVTLSQAYHALGLVQFELKDYPAAYQHCKKAHGLALKSDQTNSRMEICNCLWRSAQQAGNGMKALEHHQEYIRLRDSLLNRENSMAIARLEARLDYQERHAADSIAQAMTTMRREAAHQAELAIEQERSRNSLFISGFAAILAIAAVITVVVFRRQNHKLSRQNDLIQSQNTTIQKALQEKEVLLREVHHRVKNNLQVMISLLEMQRDKVDDPQALDALLASKGRVQAMTLIHQKLYQQDNIADLEFGTYIRQLAEAIRDLYPLGSRVAMTFDLEECNFSLDTAMPLGLILNELVTNAFKYAYEGRNQGKLHLGLRCIKDEDYALTVEDDGPGLPAAFDLKRTGSLGMQLVAGLSRQLRGRMEARQSHLGGALFIIHFKSQHLT